MTVRARRTLLAPLTAAALLVGAGLCGPAAAAPSAAEALPGAGYSVPLSEVAHTVVAKFRVPRVVCPPHGGGAGFLVTVEGGGADDLLGVGVVGLCDAGRPRYQIQVQGFPTAPPPARVRLDDQIKVTITTTPTAATLRIDDVTAGSSGSLQRAPFTPVGALVAVAGGQSGSQTAHVREATFSAVTVDGAPLAGPSAVAHDGVDGKGRTVLTTSALTAKGGFTVRYVKPAT
ncbi:hypothetical protein ACXR2U_22525 [Jatrophihabitans sp. YIM 134969]